MLLCQIVRVRREFVFMFKNLPNILIALIKYPVKTIVSFIFSIFAVTCLLWGIWWSGALLLLISILLWTRFLKVTVWCLIITFAALPLTFNSISNRMDYLGSIIRDQGAEALTYPQRISIYLGNISMGIVGYTIIAPEVANETLLLMHPSGKDRTFHSDFAMGSVHVSNIIKNYTDKVISGNAPLRSERIPLRWGEGYNSYSMFDYRVALAVAGGGLFLEYEKKEIGYKIKCRITIDVKYSEGYRLNVFNYKNVRLYIDEAIFSALQELGWFHPYYAHYHWTLDV